MPKLNKPIDGMFRAGQISSKEWARLKPNEHPGKWGSQKSKMAEFEAKERDEGNTKRKAVHGTTSRHIDRHQEMGKPAHAGGAPSKGAGVGGSKKSPTTRHINEMQTPMFPAGGGSKGKAVSGGTTNPRGPQYGGPPNRQRPARI